MMKLRPESRARIIHGWLLDYLPRVLANMTLDFYQAQEVEGYCVMKSRSSCRTCTLDQQIFRITNSLLPDKKEEENDSLFVEDHAVTCFRFCRVAVTCFRFCRVTNTVVIIDNGKKIVEYTINGTLLRQTSLPSGNITKMALNRKDVVVRTESFDRDVLIILDRNTFAFKTSFAPRVRIYQGKYTCGMGCADEISRVIASEITLSQESQEPTHIFVRETVHHLRCSGPKTCLYRFNLDGVCLSVWGFNTDLPYTLVFPRGLMVGPHRVYVQDQGLIHIFTREGQFVSKWALPSTCSNCNEHNMFLSEDGQSMTVLSDDGEVLWFE